MHMKQFNRLQISAELSSVAYKVCQNPVTYNGQRRGFRGEIEAICWSTSPADQLSPVFCLTHQYILSKPPQLFPRMRPHRPSARSVLQGLSVQRDLIQSFELDCPDYLGLSSLACFLFFFSISKLLLPFLQFLIFFNGHIFCFTLILSIFVSHFFVQNIKPKYYYISCLRRFYK